MRPPLKLNSIDQEHLQELYDATGIARDELPYTPAYDQMCEGFQDRTFKNAEPEQLFGAILKYVRSSSNSATVQPDGTLTPEQQKQLKAVLSRHLVGGKILPYSDEFATAKVEFTKASSVELTERELWQAIQRLNGAKRRPPKRVKVAAPPAEEEDDAE